MSVGLSTQRESCVVWDRRSGEALTPVLSWQDRRTEPICASLHKRGCGEPIRRKSGLPLDPMFSAAKARWLLDSLPNGQARARAGEVCIGTIDAFLLSRFGGEAVVEAGNASRTQLFDVVRATWDEELLAIFDIPLAALPGVVASIGPFPKARGLAPLPDGAPVGAVLADFAFRSVRARRLYSRSREGDARDGFVADGACRTGCHTRRERRRAWRLPDFWHGSSILRPCRMKAISAVRAQRLSGPPNCSGSRRRNSPISRQTPSDSRGVYLVPAFGGLAAPWWDPNAAATATGFSFGVTRAPFARAAIDFDRPSDR